MAYAPASNTTSTPSIAHLATVYYNRRALDQLMKQFVFMEATEPDEVPQRVGKTVQWFRYTLFAANTNPASEGAVGAGLPLTSTTVSATVAEYADYITLSTLLQETAIDDISANAAEQLGYRAGITVDTIVQTELNSTTTPELNTLGATLAVTDIRRAIALLAGIDVRPKDGTDYVGIIHPYVLYDLKSDNTAGGFIDVMRYANPNVFLGASGGENFAGQGYEAGKVEGCRLMKSTNVKTSGSAPNVLYYVYIVGKGAIGAVDLAGSGPSKVMDPEKQRFKINVIKGGPQIADPEGMIGAACSYRFVFVAKLLDTTNYRYKMIKADSSIV